MVTVNIFFMSRNTSVAARFLAVPRKGEVLCMGGKTYEVDDIHHIPAGEEPDSPSIAVFVYDS